MPSMIQGSVLAFTKWHVVRRLHDAGAVLLCTLEVPVDVIDCYVDVGRDLVPVRCAKGSALTTEHDCTLDDGQLRMANHPVAFSAEALRKAECPTEPVDRLTDVLVDQDRHYSRSWGRAVPVTLTVTVRPRRAGPEAETTNAGVPCPDLMRPLRKPRTQPMDQWYFTLGKTLA